MNTQETFYDRYWKEGYRHTGKRQGYAPHFRQWMKKQLTAGTEGRLHRRGLEAGCGDASFTLDLASYFQELDAIDISSQQIQSNQARYPQIRFLTHDLSQVLPYPDGCFDAIWCSEVLEHLFDPLFALKEFRRVIRADGNLLITVPYHGRFKNLLIALFKWDHHFDPEYPHIRFFTKNTLGRLVRKAGFARVELSTCGMSKPVRDLLVPTNILLKASV